MECFGYPELRGVSLSTHLHDKSGLPSAAARDMQIVAAGYAAQCSPAPRAAVCIYIGRMGAGAGIVLDGKVWSGAAGFARRSCTFSRSSTIWNTRRRILRMQI